MNIGMRRSLLGLSLVAAMAAFSSVGYAEDASGLKVVDVWARPAAVVGGNGAGYFTVENEAAKGDTLLKVEADVSKKVELHSMSMEGMVMKMRKLDNAPVPAHGKLVFERGGNHIMFIGLNAALKQGDSFPVTFVFEHAGSIKTTMTVQDAAPGHGQTDDAHHMDH